MVGLSALAISVAGIMTTIIIGARKAIYKGAQATDKLGKAVASLAKKITPALAAILNAIAHIVSLGAKGLTWLASNLWKLAIAIAWFIYDQYKQRRE